MENMQDRSCGALVIPFGLFNSPLEYVNVNFILGLTRTKRERGSILIAHFITCKKTIDASNIPNLFLKEIFHLHNVPKNVTFNIDTKFISHFWRSLWKNMGKELYFNSVFHP